MYPSDSRYNAGLSLGNILKILIGAGIVIITISLILLFNEVLSSVSPIWYLQLAVSGCIILVMSFLSLRIFESL